jgi:hypothetical protein
LNVHWKILSGLSGGAWFGLEADQAIGIEAAGAVDVDGVGNDGAVIERGGAADEIAGARRD